MMRSKSEVYEVNPAFVAGLMSGLALAGVTLLTAGTVRRVRARRTRHELAPFIDGVHEPDEVELDARPAEEANTPPGEPPRLESEMPEFTPMSQRW